MLSAINKGIVKHAESFGRFPDVIAFGSKKNMKLVEDIYNQQLLIMHDPNLNDEKIILYHIGEENAQV